MKIYIDADACPQLVKTHIFRAVERRKIYLIQVANQYIRPSNSKLISSVLVGQGADVADLKIVELLEEGDLVITADIPLADLCVKKNAFALNPRGELYTEANIRQRLSVRDFMTDLRQLGVETGGPPPFSQRDGELFANALDRFLTKNT
ncbi:YaiI/YqxD family protein [Lentisphaera profundi]|uniref:UPF0178 protein PQO03_10455 n=1 Tax=Lentisphaera profundi TaxID=1658616 RepID=A0ABY7VS54_9BACT|nr:YaiI/YqxD family protein [Lentisphaera profundi]WDE96134.1 YaiI/YqxD family protein [Lentisphaera profundi]